jgi:hypothetical protein
MLNGIVALHGTGVPPVTNSYESIATITVGSGGSSTITFSSIPSTYKHLQIRSISHASGGTQPAMLMRVNGVSSSGAYFWHGLEGNGSSAYAYAAGSLTTAMYIYSVAGGSFGSDVFSGHVIDVLDYANTNKNKTIRSLGGEDGNGLGYISFNSGVRLDTAAISSITFTLDGGHNFNQFSQFALYGIKG